jgi:hypothetical protein
MDATRKNRQSEARRGARRARELLADNPTLGELLIHWHWSWDESDQHDYRSPAAAYCRGFRAVLRPYMPRWRSLRGAEKPAAMKNSRGGD